MRDSHRETRQFIRSLKDSVIGLEARNHQYIKETRAMMQENHKEALAIQKDLAVLIRRVDERTDNN